MKSNLTLATTTSTMNDFAKGYDSKNSFLKDKNKHLAPPDFMNYQFGFLVKNPRRFKKPIPIAGKLRFFEVDL